MLPWRRWMRPLHWIGPRILLHLLMISLTQAVTIRSLRAEPCQAIPSGVLCTSEGFRTITDKIIEQRAERQKLQLLLADAMRDLDDMNAMHVGCEARLAAIPPPSPPRSPPCGRSRGPRG